MFQLLIRSATYVLKNGSSAFHFRGFSSVVATMSENVRDLYRLPKEIVPINYKLEFLPNFKDSTFSGHASIQLEVKEQTNKIIFNSLDLEISAPSFQDSEPTVNYDNKQEIVTFSFPNGLQTGTSTLTFDFKGAFSKDLLGMYRSSYKNAEDEEVHVLATQFEPHYARRAFPCMDEPALKATFDISVIALDNQTVLSNMPEASREMVPTPEGYPQPPDNTQYVRVTFETTPIMSTYLLALVIGQFEYISSRDSKKAPKAQNGCPNTTGDSSASEGGEKEVEIRVYTAPGKTELGRYALEVAQKSLSFYTKFFGTKYPLEKLDLIAIPDFSCGAMENWGLITYRETSLLMDPGNSSEWARFRIALTVAHECAHMWFGNLVTMAWWTDLWLNEGFATWAEFLAVDHAFPHYDIWTYYLSEHFLEALRLDELRNSHPIQVEINRAAEVEEVFDAISYQKGSSIVRMVSHLMDYELFERSLQAYIAKFKYSNATTADLWATMEETNPSGVKLTELMPQWTQQMGYPLVSVRLITAPDGQLSLGIKQRRFIADTSVLDEAPATHWRLPITVCLVNDSNKVFIRKVTILDDSNPDQEVLYPLDNLPTACSAPCIRLNPGAMAFYRVDYDAELFQGICEALRRGQIETRDRLSFLDDQFALARAGARSAVDAMRLCRLLAVEAGESSYAVWSVMESGLRAIRVMLEEATWGRKEGKKQAGGEMCGLMRFYKDLALPIYETIGFEQTEGEEHNTLFLRPTVVRILGLVGHGKVIEQARAALDRHHKAVTTSNPHCRPLRQADLIPPDMRSTVYSICMHHGGEREFTQLMELHEKTSLNEERVRLLTSLGATRDPALIDRVFSLALSEEVRMQDRCHVLMGVATSAVGRRALWGLVQRRGEGLVKDLGNSHLVARLIKGPFSKFATMEQYDELKTFFEQHQFEDCQRVIQQTLEAVKINADRWNRDGAAISEYLIGLNQEKA